MAITLRYQPPAEQLANVALATGEGQYAQTQEQVALQQEALAQRERQFLAELAQRRDIAALGANQQNRQLGAQMYQFDATRQDRAAALEYEAATQLQQEMIRQRGFADMRNADVEKQTREQKFELSQEQKRIKEHYRDQQFNVGLAAAQQIEAKKNEMTPEMYAEAQGQWAQKYGNVVGDYPFNAMQTQQGPTDEDIEEIYRSLSEYGGFTKSDAAAVARMSDQERLGFKTELMKVGANKQKAQQDMEIRREEFKFQQAGDQLKYGLEKLERESKIEMDNVNQQQLLESQANQSRLKMAADMRNLQAGLLKKELELLEEPTAADLKRIRSKMEILQQEFDTEAAGIAQPSQGESLPVYSAAKAKNAGKGEKFIFNGRKVISYGNGTFDYLD